MNPATLPPNTPDSAPDTGALSATCAAALAMAMSPIEPPPASEMALHQRLLARVARSTAANLGMKVLRKGDGVWRELAPGIRVCTQHVESGSQTTLIELDAGCIWSLDQLGSLYHPAPGAAPAAVHECLVLGGKVQLDAPALGSPVLSRHDYQMIGLDAPWLPASHLSSVDGALLCWRSSIAGASEFGATRDSHRVAADGSGWEPLRRGVQIRPLHVVGERISMLVRFEPGATVPTHPHAMGEECLMVEGELFLGDVLLREGEFQFASAGSRHDELMADVGCLLFFCGAIDPAVVDPLVRV
jgi:hypothetical protein